MFKKIKMAITKPKAFDKFDQQQKKHPSEMTRWDVIIDFIVFIGVSAGYVIQVSSYKKFHYHLFLLMSMMILNKNTIFSRINVTVSMTTLSLIFFSLLYGAVQIFYQFFIFTLKRVSFLIKKTWFKNDFHFYFCYKK